MRAGSDDSRLPWKLRAKEEMIEFIEKHSAKRSLAQPVIIAGRSYVPEQPNIAAASAERHYEDLVKLNQRLDNLYPYVGLHEREFGTGTMSVKELKTKCAHFCKHRDVVKVLQVEEELLRCKPEVLAMSIDNLHELLLKQPHPSEQLILDWLKMVCHINILYSTRCTHKVKLCSPLIMQILEHSTARLKWKTKRDNEYLYMDLSVPRYYVHIPRPAEILTMHVDDLDNNAWLLFDHHCLPLPTQNQMRRLPEDQVNSWLVPSVVSFAH